MSSETTSIASIDEDFVFTEEEHASVLLGNLNSLRESDKFCDLTLCVGVEKFSVHKCVLAASSLYFQKMFESDLLEARMNVVHMKEIEQEIMKSLLDYLYTGVVKINESNWKNLLKAAHLLDVRPLVNAVSHFLEKNLNVDNCLGIMLVAELYNCEVLKEKTLNYTLKNFSKVMESDEFLHLSEEKLIELASRNELYIENEQLLFLGIKRWFDFDPEHRSEHLHKVTETIRLPLLESNFLCNCPEFFPAFKNNPKCMQQLHDATCFYLMPIKCKGMFTKQTQPRRDHHNFTQVIATFGGNHIYNGKGLKSIDCFCPISKKTYLPTWADLPFSVRDHQVVQCQESVYLAGGYQNGIDSPSNEVWMYNQTLKIWLQVASMLESRSYFGMVSLDGYAYAFGGNRVHRDSVERYNPYTNSWSFMRNLPKPISDITAVVHDNFIYVFGRIEEEDLIGQAVYKYDPRTDRWTEVVHSSSVLTNVCGYAFDKYIYLINGYQGLNVDRFNTTNHKWKRMKSVRETRIWAGSVLINGKIYLLNGCHEIICYDIENNKFEIVGEVLEGRNRACYLPLHMKKSDLRLKTYKLTSIRDAQ